MNTSHLDKIHENVIQYEYLDLVILFSIFITLPIIYSVCLRKYENIKMAIYITYLSSIIIFYAYVEYINFTSVMPIDFSKKFCLAIQYSSHYLAGIVLGCILVDGYFACM